MIHKVKRYLILFLIMKLKRRGDMEEDPSYKQLISYCLLENEKMKY